MFHDPIIRCIKSVTHHYPQDEWMRRHPDGAVRNNDGGYVIPPRDLVDLVLYGASIGID